MLTPPVPKGRFPRQSMTISGQNLCITVDSPSIKAVSLRSWSIGIAKEFHAVVPAQVMHAALKFERGNNSVNPAHNGISEAM